MGARWYDAATGGFVSVDPVIGDLFDPQQHQAYAYARGNPVNFVDPTGTRTVCSGERCYDRPDFYLSFPHQDLMQAILNLFPPGNLGAAFGARFEAGSFGSGRTQEYSAPTVAESQSGLASASETAFRWFVYDYEEPAFGSYVAETVMVLPWTRPLKYLGRASDLLRLWGRSGTLAKHVADHAADFGARSADEYIALGSEFLQRSQVERLPTKIDSQGVIRVYDPASNTFGAFNPDGTIESIYKPDPKIHGYPSNLDYWNAQSGVSPWSP